MTVVEPAATPPPPKEGDPKPPPTETPPTGITVPKPGETPPSEGSGQTPPPKTEPGTRTFTAEDIEKARKEEKDKLYKSIEELKGQVGNLTKEREERATAEAAAVAKAEADAKAKADAELSAKELLEQTTKSWEQKFAEMSASQQRSDALLEQERKFAALMDLRGKRMAEEAEHILPELIDMVTGNSPEEIEQSIENLKTRTQSVLSNMQQATQQARQQQRGTSITAPPTGPVTDNQQGFETLSPEDIRNMDMATYAKRREQLLGAASKNRNQGLFG